MAKTARPKKKRSRLRSRKVLVAAFAAILVLAGVGAIGFTYYADSVEGITPDKLPNQITTIMAADGTQIAQLGTENRVDIDVTKLDKKVQEALFAGEDKDFYEHGALSLTSIARAAVNNSTGGDTQGGSTITQQYVKQATQQMDISFRRKLREAILARKLEENYTKDQILGFYLNTVWFGRGATGVEKASQAYFGKHAKELTYSEAAVLGAVIRNPEPDYLADGTIDPNGNKGLDPELNPEAAQDRWGYVLKAMVEKGWITAEEKAAAVYPKVIPRGQGTSSAEWGLKGVGTANVVNYVYQELQDLGLKRKDVRTGGYRITTSIRPKAQKSAEDAVKGQLKGQPANLMSALVAVNPANGEVIAYYGGDDATGYDYAGRNTEKDGTFSGGHSPGSSMKVYTLAAALQEGISLDSTWDARQITKKDENHPYLVGNAGRTNAAVAAHCGGVATNCSLRTALIQSYNVPFFYVTQQIGPDKVIKMAERAGVEYIWDNDNHAHKLDGHDGDWGRNPFDYPVGYGQYGITVLDHATGMATFANNGTYNKPHFVTKVEQRQTDGSYKTLPQYATKSDPEQRIDPAVVDEVVGTMKKVPATHSWRLDGGRDVAAKTGTWELSATSKDNAHAWVVGFTKQIAVAVWVGNKGDLKPIKYKDGRQINSGNMPGDIWLDFLNGASKGLAMEELPDSTGSVGSDDRGNGTPPSPSITPTPDTSPSPCAPETCPSESPSPEPASPTPTPSKKSPSPKPSASP